MRILSQDGNIDVNYDLGNLSVSTTNVVRFYSYSYSCQNGTVLAAYSTEEKAKKALEMLHEAYAGLPVIMKNVEVATEVTEILKETNKNAIVCQTLNGEPSSVQYVGNGYFQFPDDDEVEV